MRQSNNSQIALIHRLRELGVRADHKVQAAIKQIDPSRLQQNILALEEYALKEPLKNPIAAFLKSVRQNWQPRNDRQAWWDKATAVFGKEKRDRLINFVTEINKEATVYFCNGKAISLTLALSMSWDQIEKLATA